MILVGDVRETLGQLADGSVNCVVTSPPYWGLRDYGTAKWEGGDEECDHLPPDEAPNSTKMTSGQKTSHAGRFAGPTCYRCGAERIDSQIGLEQTPDAYVAEMVAVFRDVRRVLANDGVLWLNLGDSYCTVPHGPKGKNAPQAVGGKGSHGRGQERSGSANSSGGGHANRKPLEGLKHKDLVGIPWRVAFALQADGWYLRQDIIWHKPNPMPESVTDRCTKSHEYLFLFTKSARYHFDHDAIKEDAKWSSDRRAGEGRLTYDGKRQGQNGTGQEAFVSIVDKRNRRSVWTIPTKPFKGAHFAVMPEALVEPCILAGCPEGGTVLDPFLGSGTVAVVAQRHGREWIGCELNPAYAEIARQRIETSPRSLL